jgi:hypothetical protein
VAQAVAVVFGYSFSTVLSFCVCMQTSRIKGLTIKCYLDIIAL